MARTPVSDTIHAKGFSIRIYTSDFENEFISLTDIAKYRSNDPNDVTQTSHTTTSPDPSHSKDLKEGKY